MEKYSQKVIEAIPFILTTEKDEKMYYIGQVVMNLEYMIRYCVLEEEFVVLAETLQFIKNYAEENNSNVLMKMYEDYTKKGIESFDRLFVSKKIEEKNLGQKNNKLVMEIENILERNNKMLKQSFINSDEIEKALSELISIESYLLNNRVSFSNDEFEILYNKVTKQQKTMRDVDNFMYEYVKESNYR